MTTNEKFLQGFLAWLRENKGLEICYQTFGEWRIERIVNLNKLVAEYEKSSSHNSR